MLNVNVLDAYVYGTNTSIGPGLMQWKPRSQTTLPSAKLWLDLRPSKDLIYVYDDVIILHLSFEGPSSSDQPAL